MRRFTDAKQAKAWLQRHNIEVGHKVVARPKPQFAGLGVWGAIDYLVNYCGFTLVVNL
jgi:hypothetical protein